MTAAYRTTCLFCFGQSAAAGQARYCYDSSVIWPLRISLARLRPWNAASITRAGAVGVVFALFLWGDYLLFRRIFQAIVSVESLSPFFALGILMNLLGLVFLVAMLVLFFSSLTTSIGAFFTDHDLEVWHASPVSRTRIVATRFIRTFAQSAGVIYLFLVPVVIALASTYELGTAYVIANASRMLLLLFPPVAMAATVILLLVRFFPVRRVSQIAATLAILVLTVVVVGVRVAQPERLFTQIQTDDLRAVLEAIRLPSADLYPSSWYAEELVAGVTDADSTGTQKLLILALVSVALFLLLAKVMYFDAFVRARESIAPVAVGGDFLTRLVDRVFVRMHPQTRALASKEARVMTRDATQWSQLFMMVALLFVYIHNIRLMPLEGDARASILAYLNLGMSGFVCAAIALRFAYPSVTLEGRSFWLIRTSPISYRRLLWVKVLVYSVPLLLVSLLLAVAANVLLEASSEVWLLTLGASVCMTVTIVGLGVGMGGWDPDFELDNPLQSAVSIGGFAYMAASMTYVALAMALFARPFHRFITRVLLGTAVAKESAVFGVVTAVTISILLIVIPIEIARGRLERRDRI